MRGVVALLALAACGEHPSLRVEVEHPTDVTIATTSISVYESDLVTCDKVEFGDLSADELAAAEVDTITVGAGVPADELTMSRVDRKVIVARGFDADGANVSAGCAEKGVVGEGDELTIQTVLTAHVSVNGIGLDDADPFQIVVTVTDPLVRSLPDRVVSWRVNAAEGAQPIATANVTQGDDSDWVPTAPPCTNDSGIVRMHPVPPSTVGGFATSVRTSWSVEPPRTFTTFTPIDDSDRQSIIPVTDSKRWCALRVAGATRRLVCLENVAGTPTAFDYTVTASNGGARFAKNPVGQQITGLPSGEDPIGLVSIDRGAARDVYAITSKARAIGIFNPSIAADGAPKLLVGDASDVAVLPTCGQTRAALLVKVNGALQRELRTLAIDPTKPLGQGVSLMQYLSPSVTPPEDIDINRTGCVAELVPGGETIVHQVGVVDVSGRTGPGARNTTAGFFACNAPGGTCTIASPVGKAGVGFLPADDLHPERVVGTTFDASGFVLGVSVLQPDKLGIPRLVELERVTAASFPAHILAGQFDGDQRPDLFWDIPNLNNGSTNFQLAYAHQVGGQRLSAISTTQQDELVVDSFVADVTGDGKDDLVITSIDQLINPQLFEVRVIPGQIAIKPFTLMTDQPCGS